MTTTTEEYAREVIESLSSYHDDPDDPRTLENVLADDLPPHVEVWYQPLIDAGFLDMRMSALYRLAYGE